MDKKLQKVILEVIDAQGGETSAPLLRQKTIKQHWKINEPNDIQQKTFLHQIKLLENDGKLLKEQRPANVYYIITSDGYKTLNPWYKRTPELSRDWFSMNNPFIYILVFVLLAIIAYVALNQKWPLMFK